jgi:hypothetical protein
MAFNDEAEDSGLWDEKSQHGILWSYDDEPGVQVTQHGSLSAAFGSWPRSWLFTSPGSSVDGKVRGCMSIRQWMQHQGFQTELQRSLHARQAYSSNVVIDDLHVLHGVLLFCQLCFLGNDSQQSFSLVTFLITITFLHS